MTTDTRRWSRRYEWFVGLRYIMSRSGNRFISFISLTSMLGIAIGVAVLIIVLSVVNGFESELRSRILSMTSHAAVTAYEGGLPQWEEAREIALLDPEVDDAAPFIQGEGMLVNGERVSGAGIRGVLPEQELALGEGEGGEVSSKFPKVDRSNFTPNFTKSPENDAVDIGWSEGNLSDGRPYRLECWAQDQITNITIFVSRI